MTMNNLIPIPSVDELVADPSKAANLPADAARTLLYGLCGLLPVLLAQMSQDTGLADAPASEKFLTVAEVVMQFGVTPRWLYAHKKQLPHSQPSRKVLLFPEQKLRKWFQAHKAG